MSFALTEAQLMEGSKTVTRRTGWQNLRTGERLLAVRKAMGLKAGEKMHALCEIEVVHVKRVRLDDVDEADCARETYLTRIEFRKVPGSERGPTQQALPFG